MKTILLEKFKSDALLMKADSTQVERFIIARGYDPVAQAWYGGGSYYRDLYEAVQDWEKLKKQKKK